MLGAVEPGKPVCEPLFCSLLRGLETGQLGSDRELETVLLIILLSPLNRESNVATMNNVDTDHSVSISTQKDRKQKVGRLIETNQLKFVIMQKRVKHA